MSLTFAFTVAVLVGAFIGVLAGFFRATRADRTARPELAAWAFGGAMVAALVFGGLGSLDAILYFLNGPPQPRQLVKFTIAIVSMLGFIALIP